MTGGCSRALPGRRHRLALPLPAERQVREADAGQVPGPHSEERPPETGRSGPPSGDGRVTSKEEAAGEGGKRRRRHRGRFRRTLLQGHPVTRPQERDHAPPLPGKGHPAAHRQQTNPGHHRRGRAQCHLAQEGTRLRRCRRPGARPAQAYVRLRADLRPEPGQPGYGPAHAARLPRRRPRPGADAGRNQAVPARHANLQYPPPVQDRLPVDPDDPGAQVRADAGAVEGRASGRRRMAHPGREFQDRQAAHRLPVHPGTDAVQGTQAAGRQQRLGAAGPWHPGQALCQQRAEPGAEGVITRAGAPCLHHP